MKNPKRIITLRSTNDQDGSRHLSARLNDNGDLIIEGQDLLESEMSKFFGPEITEYEWSWIIYKANISKFVKALGGGQKDDILELLAKRFSAEAAGELQDFLDEHHIPNEFWSRLGD
jgi:hypothetical protein